MLTLKKLKYTAAAVAMCGVLGLSTDAQAQTAASTATVTVQNAVTLNVTSNINWGTIVAFAQTGIGAAASSIVDSAGAQGAIVSGVAPAGRIIIVSPVGLANTSIDITNGAPSANINVTVTNVVDPINGASVFTLQNFTYDDIVDVAVEAPVVVATPFAIPLDIAGTNTIAFGAQIATQLGVTYTDTVHAGSFDVVFAY